MEPVYQLVISKKTSGSRGRVKLMIYIYIFLQVLAEEANVGDRVIWRAFSSCKTI